MTTREIKAWVAGIEIKGRVYIEPNSVRRLKKSVPIEFAEKTVIVPCTITYTT